MGSTMDRDRNKEASRGRYDARTEISRTHGTKKCWAYDVPPEQAKLILFSDPIAPSSQHFGHLPLSFD